MTMRNGRTQYTYQSGFLHVQISWMNNAQHIQWTRIGTRYFLIFKMQIIFSEKIMRFL